jgi:hypothetical protein
MLATSFASRSPNNTKIMRVIEKIIMVDIILIKLIGLGSICQVLILHLNCFDKTLTFSSKYIK